MTARNYGLVRTAAEFVTHVRRLLSEGEQIGFDIESGYVGPDKAGVSLLPHHPDWILVGFSFTNGKDWARYVPIAHDNGDNVDNVQAVARVLWRLLNNGSIVPHNANFELTGVARFFRDILGDDEKMGAEVTAAHGYFPIFSDTLIQAKILNRYDPIRVGAGLKGLSDEVLGQKMTNFKDLFPIEDTDMGPGTPRAKQKYIRFNTRYPASPRVIDYTCEDSTAAWELSDRFLPDIKGSEQEFIYNVEMKLLPILVTMEEEALVLDWKKIHEKAEELAIFRDEFDEEIQQEFAKRTGRSTPVLLSSPKQLADVLFGPIESGGLGLPVRKRSDKTQQPSTADDALGVIAQKDQIVADILTYRRIAKLYGSYLHKYETELNYAGNGRAYPNHNQIGAGTGRMSVDGVSYQQWPKPYHFELRSGKTFDLNFRDLLISPPGFRIVGFDYSQIELRVMAGQAGEETMIEAFRNDVDIHKATAATMLRIPLEEVTKIARAKGKTINFGIVYGQGAEALADGISASGEPTTKEQAEALLADYFKGFPKLRAYMDGLQRTGSEQKFVTTPFGRKFTIWEYYSPLPYVRSKGDRLCVNAPIQGGAADYMKIGLIRAYNAIQKAGLGDKIRLVMSVHDALEFYVADDVDDQTVIDLLDPMVAFDHPALKGVPIRADWHVGQKWGHVVEIKREKGTGRITGYVNEDDDQTFETAEEAYARGLVLDEEKMARYAARIAERLAAQDTHNAAMEESIEEALQGGVLPDPEVLAEMQRRGLAPTPKSLALAEVDELEAIADGVAAPSWDTGFMDDHHVFYPHEEGVEEGPDYCRGCDRHKDDPIHKEPASVDTPIEGSGNAMGYLIATLVNKAADEAEVDDQAPMALAEPKKPAAKAPAKKPAARATTGRKETAAEKEARTDQNRKDHAALKSEFYTRFMHEGLPGEMVREWAERLGLELADITEEAPEWASRPEPEAEQDSAPLPSTETHEEVYLLKLTEMPDEDTYEVAMRWLEKIDAANTYLVTRTIFDTPEGDVEVGEHSLGIKQDEMMTKIARLLMGSWSTELRPKA